MSRFLRIWAVVLTALVAAAAADQGEANRSLRRTTTRKPTTTRKTTTTLAPPTTPGATLGKPCTDGSQCTRYYECCLQPPGALAATCQRRGSTGSRCDQRMFWPDGNVIPGIVQYQWCPCVPGEFCPPDVFGQPLQPPYTSICTYG